MATVIPNAIPNIIVMKCESFVKNFKFKLLIFISKLNHRISMIYNLQVLMPKTLYIIQIPEIALKIKIPPTDNIINE
jgi:hypothetical protein